MKQRAILGRLVRPIGFALPPEFPRRYNSSPPAPPYGILSFSRRTEVTIAVLLLREQAPSQVRAGLAVRLIGKVAPPFLVGQVAGEPSRSLGYETFLLSRRYQKHTLGFARKQFAVGRSGHHGRRPCGAAFGNKICSAYLRSVFELPSVSVKNWSAAISSKTSSPPPIQRTSIRSTRSRSPNPK